MMKKKTKGRAWIWLLLLVALAGLGYYLYTQKTAVPEKGAVAQRPLRTPEKALTGKMPHLEQTKEPPQATVQEEPAAPLKEDECVRIEKDMAAFFLYLDSRAYFQRLDPEKDSRKRLGRIIGRMAARTPLPAGESLDQKGLLRNLYHFFRVLGRKDIQLIREILENEQDTMEINLEMCYRWITLAERCPDPDGLRPPMEAVYRYAGFFLNTTGGRAYLFRRAAGTRLMVTYYSILLMHDADRRGQNRWGIDVFPFLGPIKKEIAYFPDFRFREEYLDRLNRIEEYYLDKRSRSGTKR
jgi:hypothetical protein